MLAILGMALVAFTLRQLTVFAAGMTRGMLLMRVDCRVARFMRCGARARRLDHFSNARASSSCRGRRQRAGRGSGIGRARIGRASETNAGTCISVAGWQACFTDAARDIVDGGVGNVTGKAPYVVRAIHVTGKRCFETPSSIVLAVLHGPAPE